MKNGFLKVAVTTPDLRVADCQYNKNQMVEKVKKMADEKVSPPFILLTTLSTVLCSLNLW